MNEELIARLRSRSATQPENFGLDDEAADRIEAQAARIAELEKALRNDLLMAALTTAHHAVEACASATGQRRVIARFVNKTHIANEVVSAIDAARAALAPKESSV